MVTILCCVDTPFPMYVNMMLYYCTGLGMDMCSRFMATDYRFLSTGWFVFYIVMHACMIFRHRINIIGLLHNMNSNGTEHFM